MFQYGLPVLFALFVWWFSTGIILLLNNLPARTFRWSMLGGTAVAAAACYGLAVSSAQASIAATYCAFTCAVLIWGWHEMSFFMGMLTGPRQHACAAGCKGWRHFGHGIQACLYHELAIIATAVLVIGLTHGAINQVGLWTFVVLWGMRQSSKLNVFLGVLNLNEQFLPPHLRYLGSFFSQKPMNVLFPLSVTVSTIVSVVLVNSAIAADGDSVRAAGFTFLATMTILGLVEHWFLVLPLPFAELWAWSIAARDRRLARQGKPPLRPDYHAAHYGAPSLNRGIPDRGLLIAANAQTGIGPQLPRTIGGVP